MNKQEVKQQQFCNDQFIPAILTSCSHVAHKAQFCIYTRVLVSANIHW